MQLFDLPQDYADDGVLEVAASLRESDPAGERTARVIRSTFDQLYDGQRTGRYRLSQLFKTEKTHFGTLVEINLQREFHFQDGGLLDYSIAGHEVDCKFSHTGQWMLPIESFDQIVLVLEADDAKSVWSAGVVRVTEENRRKSENRDRKTGLNELGRRRILWMHRNASLQPNVLLQLSESALESVMQLRSGQQRLNELLRTATNRRISRNIVATVAQQDDFMKRLRENGGARSALRPEGYLVLGGDYAIQRSIAIELGAATPEPGEVVSVRVVPDETGRGPLLEGRHWRLAAGDEGSAISAPIVPQK